MMDLKTMSKGPRKVLIVDDSRTIRALIRATLSADPRLEVVGEAGDPFEAREMIKSLQPDVITLDVEMPRMNGLEFLDKIMRLRPMPVVMVSTRTKERSEMAVRALSRGAVDCVDVARLQADPEQRRRLADTLVVAAGATVRAVAASAPSAEAPAPSAPVAPATPYRWNGRIVLIGSSTGGVDAIERVLRDFPADGPAVVIAQHMPQSFLKSFAQRLNQNFAPNVRLAAPGDVPSQGTILLAPGGDEHLVFEGRSEPRLGTRPSEASDLYTPSVDHLFKSAERHAARLLCVILTGMGRDGAEGMMHLKERGADTFAQTGETAVVDGMPRAARDAGAVDRNIPLDQLGKAILDFCSSHRRT